MSSSFPHRATVNGGTGSFTTRISVGRAHPAGYTRIRFILPHSAGPPSNLHAAKRTRNTTASSAPTPTTLRAPSGRPMYLLTAHVHRGCRPDSPSAELRSSP